MRFHALACDYDGTIAHDGKVDAATLAALEEVLASGRKLILVTGRELEELLTVFPELHLFALVVAENGALLYQPGSKSTQTLCSPPPERFVEALKRRGVAPLSVGHVIVATVHPHEVPVLETIRDQGLELQVIFNKESVMVLPAGVNKATGLAAALQQLELTEHEVVGVGDAENDHAFLNMCECAVAVANAVPALKEHADLVTRGARGAGVSELIKALVGNDLADLDGRLTRHHLGLGQTEEGKGINLSPRGGNVLIAGPSGSGKSTAATSFLERLLEHHYRFCIVDPEGDYSELEGAMVLGNRQRGPTVDEAIQALTTSAANTVLNLVGMSLNERPPFFLALLPRLLELRARTAKPHWLVVDEAHHLLPAAWEPGPTVIPTEFRRTLFITVHPDQMARSVLNTIETILAVGNAPDETLQRFCTSISEQPPKIPPGDLGTGEVLLWSRKEDSTPVRLKMIPAKMERQRHVRKYAEGELPPDRSFYFRGPEGKLNLRAQNLILFLQLANGVDADTWEYHLRQGDYSRWFRDRIKDPELADEAAAVERQADLSASQSRELIRQAVEKRYTLPADPPLPMPGTDSVVRSAKTT